MHYQPTIRCAAVASSGSFFLSSFMALFSIFSIVSVQRSQGTSGPRLVLGVKDL